MFLSEVLVGPRPVSSNSVGPCQVVLADMGVCPGPKRGLVVNGWWIHHSPREVFRAAGAFTSLAGPPPVPIRLRMGRKFIPERRQNSDVLECTVLLQSCTYDYLVGLRFDQPRSYRCSIGRILRDREPSLGKEVPDGRRVVC
jgi:hypothetical protein